MSGSLHPLDVRRVQSWSENINRLDDAQALHANLKDLKTGIVTASIHHETVQVGTIVCPIDESHQTVQVRWDEHHQTFSVTEINIRYTMRGGDFSDAEEKVTEAAINIAEQLNQCENRDRETRRADRYQVGDQDTAGFHQDLLSNPNYHVTIAHDSREEVLLPDQPQKISASSSKIVADESKAEIDSSELAKSSEMLHSSDLRAADSERLHTSRLTMQSRPILLYGFDQPRDNSPRENLKSDLQTKFGLTNIQTVNDYNAGFGIGVDDGPFDFEKHCEFIEDLQLDNLSSKMRLSNSSLAPEELKAWANCLMRHVSKFDFSEKLGTPEKRIQFFLKNCDMKKIIGKHSLISEKLKNCFISKDWNGAIIALGPAFDLLANTKPPINRDALKACYAALVPEQKQVLDVMLSKAFFRKTSKLGMTFAQEQGELVVFAWKASGVTNLDQLHKLLEVKPYKAISPSFRINEQKTGIGRQSPEAITFSEMRELGRLKQKMMAPKYLLITDIKAAAGQIGEMK